MNDPARPAPHADAHSPRIAEKERSPLTWKQRAGRLLRNVAVLYVLLVALLTINQRSLIYHPRKVNRLEAAEAGLPPGTLHDFQFTATDGLSLKGWHFLRGSEVAHSEEHCRRLLGESPLVVLYFPGNAGHRGHRVQTGRMLAQRDVDVLIADYRGYGDNPGSPNESMLLSDAHAFWAFAVHACGVSSDRIVIYGQSLGGGVAVRLAAELCDAGTPPAGLITVASFSSLGDVAQAHFPLVPARWLLWDEFRSRNHISQVTAPFLHLHGTHDETVPYSIGTELFEAAPAVSAVGIPKQLVTIKGARHNNLYSAGGNLVAERAIGSFFERVRRAAQ
jgi:uncharacterized protein